MLSWRCRVRLASTMSKGKTFLPPKPMESMPMPTETAGIDATANSNPGSASSKKKRRGRPKKWSRTATAAKAGNKSKKKRYQPTGRPVGRPRKSITPVRDDASAFAPPAGATSETDPRVPRHHSPEFYRPKTAVKNEEEEGQDELLADEELAEAKLNAVAGYSEEIILPSATAGGASATSAMVCTPYTSQDVLMDQFFDTPVPVFYYQPVLPQCANENADNIHLNHPQGRLPFQPLPPPPIPPPNQPGKYVYYRRFIPDDPKALSSKDAKHTAAAANASLKENMHPNVAPTPVKRKRGRPPKSASKKAALVSASSFAATPKSNGKAKSRFATSTTPRSGSRSSIRVKSKSSSPFSISNTNISSFASLSNSNSSSGKITRRTACGTCAVCTQQDCRKCKYCKDMKRYGGPQKLKQKCIMRGSCPFANVENPYFCRRTSHDDGAGGVIDTDGNYCVVVVNGVDAGRCVDSSLGNGGSVGNASSGGGATDFSGSGHAEEVAAETTVESAGNSSNVNKMNRDGNDADDADSDYDQSQDEDEDDDDDDDDDEYFPGKKNKNDAPKKRVKIEADEFVALKSQALAAITISAVGPRNELDNSTANANSLGPSIPKDDTNLNRQATAEIETDENPMRNLEEDCRKCRYCLDMTRYGGPGKLKQRCQYKRRRPLKSKNLNHAANTLDSASKKKGSTGGAFVATPSGLTIRASRRHIKKEDVKAANEVFGRYMKSYASIMSVDNGKTSPDSSSLKDIMSHRIPRKKSTAKERSTHPAGHASESSIQSKNFATTAANDGGSSSTEGSFRKQSPARVSNKSSFVTPISTVKTTKSSLQIRIGQSSKNTSTAAADTKSISESSSSPNNAKLGTTLAPTTSKTSDKKFIETPTTWNPERVDCNGMTLPEIVFALVCDASQNFSHVLHWTEDGDAFYVDETHEELELLVGKYFKHGKFNSLKRQLYLYGWRKQKGVYTNPRFHRDLTKVDDLKKIGKGFWRHDASCPNADEILMIDSAKSKVASDDSETSVPLNRSVLKRKAFSHACSSIKNVLCGEGKLDPVLEDEDEGDETDRAQEYTNEYEEAKSLLQLRSTPNHEHDDIDDTLSFEPTQSESWLPGESEDKCSEAKDTAMNTIESSKPTDESVTFPADIATTPNPIQSRYSDPLDGNIMSTAEYEREVMEMGPVFEFSPYPDVGTNRLDALVNMAELVDRAGSSRVKALPIRPPQFATRPQFSPIVLPSSQEKPPKPASVATSTDYSAREEPEQLAAPHVIASPSKIQTSNNVDDVQLSWKSTGTFTLGALEAMPEELPSLTADDRA